jgi:TolB protein
LIATDTSGGGVRRLTQGHGSNAYPACSPDGRLVAFFSTGANGKSPGLYVLPISNPSRIRKLADDHGDALAWAR